MGYATEQDFIEFFELAEMVQLTNLNNAGATAIDSARLAQAQARAKGLIDMYAASCPSVRAVMPFVEPYPQALKLIEMDITRYFLDSNLTREGVVKRYEDSIKILEKLAACKTTLGLVGEPETVLVTNNLDGSFGSSPTYFGGSTLDGY